MAAGISMTESDSVEILRDIARRISNKVGIIQVYEEGIWRFLTHAPNAREIVCLWGNALPGDLVMPWPMIVSHESETNITNDPYAFWVSPPELYTIVKVDTYEKFYRFCLLPTWGDDSRLIWFFLPFESLFDLMTDPEIIA